MKKKRSEIICESKLPSTVGDVYTMRTIILLTKLLINRYFYLIALTIFQECFQGIYKNS